MRSFPMGAYSDFFAKTEHLLTIASSSGNKRKFLTLEQRIKVVELAEKGQNQVDIARDMGCGRTQIAGI